MPTTILQVGGLPPALADAVTAKYNVLVLPTDGERSQFLAQHAASVRAIVDAGQVDVDAELIGALPNLGAIVHYGDGHETVDTDAASRRGIGVSNTPDVLTDTVADAGGDDRAGRAQPRPVPERRNAHHPRRRAGALDRRVCFGDLLDRRRQRLPRVVPAGSHHPGDVVQIGCALHGIA